MPHIVVNDTTPRELYIVGGTPSSGPFVVPAAFAVFDPATDLKFYNGTTLLTYSAAPTLATEWGWTTTNAGDGGHNGGEINLGAVVSNTTLVLTRDIPIARTSDFPYPQGTLNIEALNTQLDKIFAIEQDNELRYLRTLRQPLSDITTLNALPVAASRASKFLAFDADGQPTAQTGTGTAGPAGAGVPVGGAANEILAKINATDNNTQWLGLSALIDAVIGSTRGQVLARNATVWAPITVGAAGSVFRSNGTDPLWATLSATLDVLFGTTQGAIIYRGAATWAALAAGTSGQFLKTLGAGSNPVWAAGSGWVHATAQQPSVVGEIDFTAIPAGVNVIDIAIRHLTHSGTDNLLVQLGDSGGIETTGYEAAGAHGATTVTSTAGFPMYFASAAYEISCIVSLRRLTGNVWTCAFAGGNDGGTWVGYGGGHKELTGEIDRIRIEMTGANTITAENINIMYQ